MMGEYPCECVLTTIREWPTERYAELLQIVQEEWKYPDYFSVQGRYYIVSTAGWSGNEELIGALQKNTMFWTICWMSSTRGGKHQFEIPEYMAPTRDGAEQAGGEEAEEQRNRFHNAIAKRCRDSLERTK